MSADLGGTELLEPLRKIYSTPADIGRPRNVFLLTDGGVSNLSSVKDLVAKNAGKSEEEVVLFFVLRKIGSETKKRTKEEGIVEHGGSAVSLANTFNFTLICEVVRCCFVQVR